jgi:hypothetical protein
VLIAREIPNIVKTWGPDFHTERKCKLVMLAIVNYLLDLGK